jgi:hypothetical protein
MGPTEDAEHNGSAGAALRTAADARALLAEQFVEVPVLLPLPFAHSGHTQCQRARLLRFCLRSPHPSSSRFTRAVSILVAWSVLVKRHESQLTRNRTPAGINMRIASYPRHPEDNGGFARSFD